MHGASPTPPRAQGLSFLPSFLYTAPVLDCGGIPEMEVVYWSCTKKWDSTYFIMGTQRLRGAEITFGFEGP